MKILTGTFLIIFVGLMFLSLLQTSNMMSMSHSVSDCASMSHQEVICSVSLSEKISTWKSVFFNLILSTLVLSISIGSVILITGIASKYLKDAFLHKIPILWSQLINRTYTYLVRSMQELFSNGILHPKLF